MLPSVPGSRCRLPLRNGAAAAAESFCRLGFPISLPSIPESQGSRSICDTDALDCDICSRAGESAGGPVGSSAEPQRGPKERAPRNKSASLQARVPPAEADVAGASADLDSEFRLQGLHFTLRLLTDPTTHLVVGQKEDTVRVVQLCRSQ